MDPTATLAYAFGKPTVKGSIKITPDHFIVDELLSFEPSGTGEHAFIQIEKWGENTDFISRQLARFTQTKARDIGYAGLKDRHGRTRQWFSVQLPGMDDPDWTQCHGENFRVVAHTRNDRKLRRGAIKANRFTLTLKELSHPAGHLAERIQTIALAGVPNYFGPQRFGRDGDNVDRALDLMQTPNTRINPHLRGIFFSAARSEIFNQILSERVEQGCWNIAIPGDVYMFADSKSYFEADAHDDEIIRRIHNHEIHPSGVLIGEKPSIASKRAEEIEQSVLKKHKELHEGLVDAKLETLRRPFRLVPEQLSFKSLDDRALMLCFSLPAGAYATTVLRELIQYDATQQPEL